jgi:sortase A
VTGQSALLWIERGLTAAGISLALWCALVVAEARFFAGLPVPPAERPVEGLSTGIVVPARGSWVAKLDAPTARFSATILEGSDDETLARGAGRIEWTAFPGERGNVGIAAHRDTTFRPVRHLRIGDPLELTTTTHVFRYRITRTLVVDPEDVHVLDSTGVPMLTLVTCYPFDFIGSAPQRYIVQAALTSQSDRQASRAATEQARR